MNVLYKLFVYIRFERYDVVVYCGQTLLTLTRINKNLVYDVAIKIYNF